MPTRASGQLPAPGHSAPPDAIEARFRAEAWTPHDEPSRRIEVTP
ncbi:hypothetical protein [Aliidongia dinghuensis]|nr:hypothetical protein [Aliidongia dinghuensis]